MTVSEAAASEEVALNDKHGKLSMVQATHKSLLHS